MATNKPINPLGTTPYLFYTGTLATSAQADASKMTNGWNTAGEKPKRNHQNGLFKYLTQFVQHVNDYGVPQWDTVTVYEPGALVMHTDNEVYRCILTTTAGQDPSNATRWTKYSAYIAPPATETVSGIREIATDAEAQALAADDKFMTPLKFKNALKGSNQSLAANGYQKLPGGLIMQWGTASVTSSGTSTTGEAAVTFPVTFPSALVNISITLERPSGAATGVTVPYFRLQSTSGFNAGLDQVDSSNLPYTVHWQALGY